MKVHLLGGWQNVTVDTTRCHAWYRRPVQRWRRGEPAKPGHVLATDDPRLVTCASCKPFLPKEDK